MGQELPFAKKGVDYPLAIHVSGVHIRDDWAQGYSADVVFVDITSNGKKLELQCSGAVPAEAYLGAGLLSLGDFHARALKKVSGGAELGNEYELLLPNHRVLGCTVSGMFE